MQMIVDNNKAVG